MLTIFANMLTKHASSLCNRTSGEAVQNTLNLGLTLQRVHYEQIRTRIYLEFVRH